MHQKDNSNCVHLCRAERGRRASGLPHRTYTAVTCMRMLTGEPTQACATQSVVCPHVSRAPPPPAPARRAAVQRRSIESGEAHGLHMRLHPCMHTYCICNSSSCSSHASRSPPRRSSSRLPVAPAWGSSVQRVSCRSVESGKVHGLPHARVPARKQCASNAHLKLARLR